MRPRVRTLFIRIFLWFWLAMVLVNVALFLSVFLTEMTEHTPRNPPHHEPTAAALGIYAQTAAEICDREGAASLAAYLDRVAKASHVRAMLFDQDGRELSGHAGPPGAEDLARSAVNLNVPVFNYERRPALAAEAVRSPSGRQYILVGEMPEPPFGGPFGANPKVLAMRMLALLLTGGLLCYWLAHYLTSPVTALRATTQELAGGNLKARVGDKLTAHRDEIGHLGRDFNIMAERIETLVTAERRLLGDISHELRSPLTRLTVALELARRGAAPGANGALDRIAREANSINEMIGQLLTLSRFESGVDGIKSLEIDLCVLLGEVAADADFEARSRGRSVYITGCTECATSGAIDLLRSAIENVVRNAVRHTREGTEVDVRLRLEEMSGQSYAIVTIRDHGPGVPESAMNEIFRPFYRVEDARDRQSGGAGLGLAIAARAVRLHGGTIKAANAAGGGLVVDITLPVKSQ